MLLVVRFAAQHGADGIHAEATALQESRLLRPFLAIRGLGTELFAPQRARCIQFLFLHLLDCLIYQFLGYPLGAQFVRDFEAAVFPLARMHHLVGIACIGNPPALLELIQQAVEVFLTGIRQEFAVELLPGILASGQIPEGAFAQANSL